MPFNKESKPIQSLQQVKSSYSTEIIVGRMSKYIHDKIILLGKEIFGYQHLL